MTKYMVTGSIYPLETSVSIQRKEIRLNVNQKRVDVSVGAESNTVTMFVTTHEDWAPEDLLEVCEGFTQHLLDVIAFVSTRAVEVYMHSLMNEGTGENYSRASLAAKTIPTRFEGDALQNVFAIQQVFGNQFGYQMMRALDDFRLALRRAEDTGFHCFRALECLRVYCRLRYDLGENKGAQWRKVREISGATEEELKWIGGYGTPQRHGDFKGITGEERRRLLENTREIIDRFMRAEFSSERMAARARMGH